MYDDDILDLLEYHYSMLADKVRMESYLRAILKSVKPGDIVLDIGCGTGILSCFACMSGAERVYAVEHSPIIELAKSICLQNGFKDRIVFLDDWSTHVELPESVDLIVTETIGNFAFDEGILGSISDAKSRLLKEGGQIIPSTVELVLVPVESLTDYEISERWRKSFYTLDFSPVRELAVNIPHWTWVSPESFLSEPNSTVCIDLSEVDEGEIGGEISFKAERDGTFHGIAGWFEAELIPGLKLSNEPPIKTPSWKQTFLPSELPVPIRVGDNIIVKIRSASNFTDWNWEVIIRSGEQYVEAGADQFHRYQLSTLAGQLGHTTNELSLEDLPKLNEEGEIDRYILDQLDGSTSIVEISRKATDKFPIILGNFEKALDRVNGLVVEYSSLTNASFD